MFRVRSAQHALTIICVFSLLVFSSERGEADSPNTRRSVRAKQLGPLIVTAPGYSVHMKGVVFVGGVAQCPEAIRQPLSLEEKNRIRMEVNAGYAEIKQEQLIPAEKAQNEFLKNIKIWESKFSKGKITKQEQREKVRAAEAEIKRLRSAPLAPDLQERYDKLTARLHAVSPQIILSLQHRPNSPNETIVPMKGKRPSQRFVEDLGRRLEGFLKTCGSSANEPRRIVTLHYYEDEFLPLTKNRDREDEIVNFSYRLEKGALIYVPSNEANWLRDPEKNPNLTLAGLRQTQQEKKSAAREREQQRSHFLAKYRSVFEYPEGRQDGIVYKLDPFWRQYESLDEARRIFDGDFLIRDQRYFKFLHNSYAEIYSKHCTTDSGEMVLYRIPSRDYMGTEWHLDGSSTKYYKDTFINIYIDRRFTPEWGDYHPEFNLYMMERLVGSQKTADFSKNWVNMSGREFLDAVGGVTQEMLSEIFQMREFIVSNQCQSATVEQMTENFIRAAKKQPSAQQAKLYFDGSNRESDAPTKTGPPPTVYFPITGNHEKLSMPKQPHVESLTKTEAAQEGAVPEYGNPTNNAGSKKGGSVSVKEAPKARQGAAQSKRSAIDRRERIRQIDEETNQKIATLTDDMHKQQLKDAEGFRKRIIEAKNIEERTALQEEYSVQQRVAGEKFRQEIQELRVEANKRKNQL